MTTGSASTEIVIGSGVSGSSDFVFLDSLRDKNPFLDFFFSFSSFSSFSTLSSPSIGSVFSSSTISLIYLPYFVDPSTKDDGPLATGTKFKWKQISNVNITSLAHDDNA